MPITLNDMRALELVPEPLRCCQILSSGLLERGQVYTLA